MRVVGDFFGVPNRLVVDVRLVENRGHLFLGLIRRPLFQPGVNLHLTLGLYAGIVLGILSHVAITDCLAKAGKVLVLVSADEDVALLVLLRVL